MACRLQENRGGFNIQNDNNHSRLTGINVEDVISRSESSHTQGDFPATGFIMKQSNQITASVTSGFAGKAAFRSLDSTETSKHRDISESLPKTPSSTPMENVMDYHHEQLSGDMADEDVIFPDTDSLGNFTWRNKFVRCVNGNRLLGFGIFVVLTCAIVTSVLLVVLSNKLTQDIKQGRILRESSSSSWTLPHVNACLTIYTFGLHVDEDGAWSVTEKGPFVHRLDIQKVNLAWHSNSSVSYREKCRLISDAEHSNGSEHGMLQNIAFVVCNESADTLLNVYTGESNFSQIYQTFSWNNNRKLPFWKSEHDNEIRGTDGSDFQPFLYETTKLTVFYPQLKRTFDLNYSESTTYKSLPVHRFTIPDSEFFNSTRTSGSQSRTEPPSDGHNKSSQVEENGYCTTNCVPDGMYIFSEGGHRGPHDLPLYVSLPHFLGADPFYHQLVRGLLPDESKHRPVFKVDKITGITLLQKRRFQVNMYHKEPMSVIPLYWFELSVEVTDDVLREIQQINQSFQLLYGVCISVGVTLCLSLMVQVLCLINRTVKARTATSRYARLSASHATRCCRAGVV